MSYAVHLVGPPCRCFHCRVVFWIVSWEALGFVTCASFPAFIALRATYSQERLPHSGCRWLSCFKRFLTSDFITRAVTREARSSRAGEERKFLYSYSLKGF